MRQSLVVVFGLVAMCSLLLSVVVWLLRSSVKRRLRELEAAELAELFAEEAKIAADKKRQREQAA